MRPRDLSVDAVDELVHAGRQIARAITVDTPGRRDAFEGHVDCLTEAVMGVTRGLQAIAAALEDLASAVREHGNIE
jgi:hypothetical protein